MLTSSVGLLHACATAWRPPLATRIRCVAGGGPGWQRRVEEKGIEFIKGFEDTRGMPELRLPEFALLGRSNVGKSSALNALSGRRKKIAVSSKTPGRTRLINLYQVQKTCCIADLPGYGFAKVSQDMQQAWRKSIQQYLTKRDDLKLAVLLVDAQRDPQELDAQLLDFLAECGVPVTVVATKIDKLHTNDVQPSLLRLRESLNLPDDQPLPFSATTGTGKKKLWQRICWRDTEGRNSSSSLPPLSLKIDSLRVRLRVLVGNGGGQTSGRYIDS